MKNNVWEDKLAEGEKIEYEFSLGKKYVKTICIIEVIFGIILLPVYGLGILFIIAGIGTLYILPFENQYAFTNKRVLLLKRSFKSKLYSVKVEKLTSINLDQITDVHVRLSWGDSFYKTGTLALETAGKDSETVIKHIENPYQIMKNLNSLRDKARKQ